MKTAPAKAVAADRADDSIPAACTKVEIVDRLAALNGYRSYLELCTPTSGLFYAEVVGAGGPIASCNGTATPC